jgi:outer membrane protein OmpA-like peptidoglycan-associated protein
MRAVRAGVCCMLIGCFAVLGVVAAEAEDLNKEQIIQSLQAKSPTAPGASGAIELGSEANGATPPPPGMQSAPAASPPSASPPSRHDLADQLRHMTNNTRQITVEERNKVAKTVEDEALPTIDVEVFFAYDSSAILPQAIPKLITLGQALSDPRLKGSTFLIGGHTDAKGSDAYNLRLSGERAAAVKRFLVDNFHVEPESLITLGFGEEQLQDPQDPFGGENRRVQIVNIEAAAVAQQ